MEQKTSEVNSHQYALLIFDKSARINSMEKDTENKNLHLRAHTTPAKINSEWTTALKHRRKLKV
jgi:hypothetical protein